MEAKEGLPLWGRETETGVWIGAGSEPTVGIRSKVEMAEVFKVGCHRIVEGRSCIGKELFCPS